MLILTFFKYRLRPFTLDRYRYRLRLFNLKHSVTPPPDETTSVAGITKESTSGKGYDDETASDDDSEDNSMVKSYQKNLDYSVNMRMVGVPEPSFEYWAAKFIVKGHVTSALPFGLMSASFGLWIGINWFSWIG
ncbi:hypothetical protein C1646_773521 [Rhizophagus diaphanus]|nr:hypothetical protein C1646_773521 [Rhizophagus diaphanus] [Rhizophagus sp. MUCL 43196]